jgi:hypothetical protein
VTLLFINMKKASSLCSPAGRAALLPAARVCVGAPQSYNFREILLSFAFFAPFAVDSVVTNRYLNPIKPYGVVVASV